MMLNGPRGILTLARSRERTDGARGQIMVLFTLVIVLLMVLAAVVIDAGLLRTDSARLQNALDAGALAAAQSLPANSTNIGTVRGAATSYSESNFPGLGLGTNDITFACIIGIDTNTGGPHFIDMPAVCNVPVASDWVCTAAVCWAPCDPVAHTTDVCNTVILKKDVTRDYTFARAVGINSGNTGTIQAAACTGPCGPTMPVDVVLTIDRTLSMQGLENTLFAGANAVLQAYDPTIQHIALGMIGPSSQLDACSTGAMGKILVNGTLTAPPFGSSSTNSPAVAQVAGGRLDAGDEQAVGHGGRRPAGRCDHAERQRHDRSGRRSQRLDAHRHGHQRLQHLGCHLLEARHRLRAIQLHVDPVGQRPRRGFDHAVHRP